MKQLILRIVLSNLIWLGRYTIPAFRTQCSWCVIIQNRKWRRAMSDFKRLGVVTGVLSFGIVGICLLGNCVFSAAGQDAQPVKNSYMPVDDKESFAAVHDRMAAAKAGIMKRQMDLLEERYNLSDRPAKDAGMDRTKPVQEGVRVTLPPGVTWNELASD